MKIIDIDSIMSIIRKILNSPEFVWSLSEFKIIFRVINFFLY
jgi:hypothetical protein